MNYVDIDLEARAKVIASNVELLVNYSKALAEGSAKIGEMSGEAIADVAGSVVAIISESDHIVGEINRGIKFFCDFQSECMAKIQKRK